MDEMHDTRGPYRREVLGGMAAVGVGTLVGSDAARAESNDAVEIEDWHDLHAIRDDLEGDYILTNDLDETTAGYDEYITNSSIGWEPIGPSPTGSSPFTGSIDGNGHSIIGLRIDAPPDEFDGAFGLFSFVHDSTIRNLSLEGVEINAVGAIGALVGYAVGSNISSVSVQGSIEAPSDSESRCGGILGIADNTEDSENSTELRQIEANVNIDGGAVSGGICGAFWSDGLIQEAHTSGSVSGGGTGGIVGAVEGQLDSDDKSTIRRASTSARVQIRTDLQTVEAAYGGGLVGNCINTTINSSSSTGSISAVDVDEEWTVFIGGIGGSLFGSEVADSYSTASVTGTEGSGGGGLAGVVDETSIETCYAAGEVRAEGESGGLVPSSSYTDTGNVEITDSYWDVEATAQSSSSGVSDDNGLSTDEMQGSSAQENMSELDFEETWEVTDGYPRLIWEPDPFDDEDSDLRDRLQSADVEAQVTIGGQEYLVLQNIPDEPEARFAYTDPDYRLLEPDAAVDVALSYRFCHEYVRFSNIERRLEIANDEYEEYGDLEALAAAANLLSELSGVIALSKVSPLSAASNAVDALQVAVDWSDRQLTDPYHEQFVRMAAASDAVNWSDEHTTDPGGSLLELSDEALDLTDSIIGAHQAVDATAGLATSASTVRDVFSEADGIRDDISPSNVDGVEDLQHAGYTVLASMATDAVVDAVSDVAEAQARIAAMGQGQAAARRPLLTELLELEERASEFDLAPAGILRIHTLQQADYQIQSAALYGQAELFEEYQSGGLGSIIGIINGTEDTPEQAREHAETWRDLSHEQANITGQYLQLGIDDYNASLNAERHGEQTVLTQQ